MRMTQEQFDAYQVKAKAWRRGDPALDLPDLQVADEGRERELAGKIQRWADAHGYPCQCFRQTAKARGFLVPGWPDVTLIVQGRVIFMELKAKNGRLSNEQKQVKLKFLHLHAEWYEVRSFKRFLEIVVQGIDLK